MPASNSTAASGSFPSPAAEAARYALLRRLAPSMRHHLVVNLQPIGMVYEIMDRRLRAEQPNLADVHEGAQKMNAYARSALAACLRSEERRVGKECGARWGGACLKK